jgi:hypothetical protein
MKTNSFAFSRAASRHKLTPSSTQIQDILQWQQSYNSSNIYNPNNNPNNNINNYVNSSNTNTAVQATVAGDCGDGSSGELVVSTNDEHEQEPTMIPLTRELLLEAKQSSDGLPVAIGTVYSLHLAIYHIIVLK